MATDFDFDIKEELKKLPKQPGVYIMHDENDAIIYVGKAIILYNRVRQYFQAGYKRSPKIEQMVKTVRRFEYIVTDSELEALVLENNLIKEHRPRYNTMLTDDKTYPYIKVSVGETYPRITMTRKMKKDKSRYFGPFTSAWAVRDTIDLIRRIYHIRDCNRSLPKEIGNDRPCLYHHIHQCDAPCQGYISAEDYKANVDKAMEFLSGNFNPVLKMLEDKMMAASEQMEFEEAASWRDLLTSVKHVAQRQKITSEDVEDKDVIALAVERKDAIVQVFFVRGGRLIGRDHFWIKVGMEDTPATILSDFMKQFYAGTPYVPRELLLAAEVEDQELIEQWLTSKRGGRVYIKVPKKGTKERMVEMAAENARIVLAKDKERIKREEGRTIGAVREIAQLLGMQHINRMEAFDISNISGFESVGSMVVFEKGKPKHSDYRKFKIQTVQGPNDYASMEEVLTRRFSHGLEEQRQLKEKGMENEEGSFSVFPDLLMMDGGRGQVNIAEKVLDKLGIDLPVCGMVKDDNHRTRGLCFHNVELPIDTRSEGFKLITRVQDEAHRFAIEYHRSLRGKKQVHSLLDDIPGIGPARRKALMRAFGSMEAIRDAEEVQIAAVPSMNAASARAVYEFFRQGKAAVSSGEILAGDPTSATGGALSGIGADKF